MMVGKGQKNVVNPMLEDDDTQDLPAGDHDAFMEQWLDEVNDEPSLHETTAADDLTAVDDQTVDDIVLPDFDVEDLEEEKLPEMPHLKTYEEALEEEVALSPVYDPWIDDDPEAIAQSIEESIGAQYQDDPDDDRHEVLASIFGNSDDVTGDADSAHEDDGLLETIHQNSPFAAVDDSDGLPGWFSLDSILSDAIDQEVSDIYIVADNYVYFKKFDQMYQQKQYGFILPDMTEKLYMAIITNVQEADVVEQLQLDAAYTIRTGRHTGRRFRMLIAHSFSNVYLNFRVIPHEVPSPEVLGVPQQLIDWSNMSRGVFMVNGPTGSGKSTTIASLVHAVQKRKRKMILTLESPIEFEYPKEVNSLVIQREIGMDARSFAMGLKAGLRQAPDIIVVGEVRDRLEVDEFLRAAETGHLAISTMHTETCAGTISRMTGLYEGSDKRRVTDVLSTVARGFANQLLLLSPDGKKRNAVHEILEVDAEVSELIAANDIQGIQEYQDRKKQSMEHVLVRAFLQGKCSMETAMEQTSRLPMFRKILAAEDV